MTGDQLQALCEEGQQRREHRGGVAAEALVDVGAHHVEHRVVDVDAISEGRRDDVQRRDRVGILPQRVESSTLVVLGVVQIDRILECKHRLHLRDRQSVVAVGKVGATQVVVRVVDVGAVDAGGVEYGLAALVEALAGGKS